MADVFKRRCGCGRILGLREGCTSCAERERARLHAVGVARDVVWLCLESDACRCPKCDRARRCMHLRINHSADRCADCGTAGFVLHRLGMHPFSRTWRVRFRAERDEYERRWGRFE